MAINLSPSSVAAIFPVLEGASNWKTWQEKLQEVIRTINPLYWDILTGKLTAPVYNPYTQDTIEEMACKYNFPQEAFTHVVFDVFLEIDDTIKQRLYLQYQASVEIWKYHVAEARNYLSFSLGERPASHLKDIVDPRAAYLKLETLYSNVQAKPNVHA